MKEDNKEYYSMGEILKIITPFIKYLRNRWWVLMLAGLVGAGLGLLFYYLQKPKYEAVTTFVLEEKSGAGGGALAGLASQFGLNLGGLTGGGSIFSGDNILEILTSKKIVKKVLLTKVDETSSRSETLADLYLEFTGLKKTWQKNDALRTVNFGEVSNKLSPVQDSLLNVIYQGVIKKNLFTDRTSKKSSIVKVQVTSSDRVFARLMTTRLVDEASKMYTDIRVGTAQENIRQMQRRSDSLLMLLNNKSFSAAATQPLDINPGIRTAIVPGEIASRDKTVLATIYGEVTKNLEASKMLLSQQTPVIELLDQPEDLLVDKRKGRLLLMAAFAIVTGLLYVMGVFLYFVFFNQAESHGRE